MNRRYSQEVIHQYDIIVKHMKCPIILLRREMNQPTKQKAHFFIN